MGLFDDIFSNLDHTLEQLEQLATGAEERLTQFADTVEEGSTKVTEVLGTAADKPAELLQAGEEKLAGVQEKTGLLQQRIGQHFDIIPKK